VSLIYLSCAWVAGFFLGSKLNLPWVFITVGLIPLPLLFFTSRHRKSIIMVSLCLIAFFVGAYRFQSSLDTSLQHYNDRETIAIRGMIDEEPEVRDRVTHIRLKATQVKLDEEWQDVSGTALLFVPHYPDYHYGDVLRVTGKLETPPRFDDFDYRAYLARHGIYSTVLYPEIDVLERGRGSPLLAGIYRLREHFSQTLTKVLPEPQASLAQGIVLGIRGNMPSPLKDNFSRTGTVHLLAISGLHLSIVAGIMLSLGIWLFGRRRYLYVWLALGAIWFYALITGMNAPVLRGAIMASLFLTAELLGRQRSAITSLALAAAVMVGISPQVLWHVSFQLSFLAMAGLIFIFPRLQAVGRRAVGAVFGEEGTAVSLANVTADGFSVSLSAILATWPVVAHYFGIVSLVGPLATLLALPALPAIIITGALAGGLGFIALPLAQATGWFAWLFLSYLLLVVNGFAALPVSSIEAGSVDAGLIWTYYLVVVIVLWVTGNKRGQDDSVSKVVARLKSGAGRPVSLVSRLPGWVMPPLLVIALLTSLVAVSMPDGKLHVSFLDVGQGDAILIQTPAGQDILVDGGPSPQSIGLALGRQMPFWDRTIDLVVLTHAQADHITGLLEVLQRYKVKQVLYPAFNGQSPLSDRWLGLIQDRDVKSTVAQAGQRIEPGDGLVIKVLNPPVPGLAGTQSDIDNNAVVLEVSLGDISFLLTADIMSEAELELIAHRACPDSTVLKVAHHGSDTSTIPEFLAVVNPRLAVISVGEDNTFGHPEAAVTERFAQRLGKDSIYRTDEDGTVEFITDGKRLWVKKGE